MMMVILVQLTEIKKKKTMEKFMSASVIVQKCNREFVILVDKTKINK